VIQTFCTTPEPIAETRCVIDLLPSPTAAADSIKAMGQVMAIVQTPILQGPGRCWPVSQRVKARQCQLICKPTVLFSASLAVLLELAGTMKGGLIPQHFIANCCRASTLSKSLIAGSP